MAITCTPRKITAAEQARLRRDGQWTELYCVIDPSPPMWTALLDATKPPAGNDGIHQVNFTTGAYVSPYTSQLVYEWATLWIGTQPGARDLGSARLRGAYGPGTGVVTGAGAMNINETSEVDWLSGEAAAGTGTVTINGTTAVVGTGTAFTTQLAAGKVIVVNGEARVVATITDNTHLSASVAFTTSASTQAFTYYSAQATVYLTLIDEYTIWPRDLRTVGPNSVTGLTELVTVTTGSLYLNGALTHAGTGNLVVDGGVSSTIIRALVNGTTHFLTTVVAGDYLLVPNWGYGIRKIVTVVDDNTLIVDSPYTQAGAPTWYYGTTRFLSQFLPGDNVTVGAETRQVVSIISDRILMVDTPWTHTTGAYPYMGEVCTATRLTIFMDYDLPLSPLSDDTNQHYERPTPFIPNMGPPIVVDQHGSNPVVIQLDCSATWGFDADQSDDQRVGGFLRLWRTTGGTLSSTSSATPTLTVTTPGVYRVSCLIVPTSGLGGNIVGKQKIYVIGDTASNADPLDVIQLTSCSGDEANGWAAGLTVYGADADLIRNRAQAVIFARDHYGDHTLYSDATTPIGQVTASANVIMAGWITGESIKFDAELSEATFRIEGPLYWLNRITGLPTAFEHVNTQPGLWTQMYHLTVDRALWHLLIWRTTLPGVADVYLTGDLRRLSFLEGKAGSLASQVQQIATQSILARLVSDRYGRVFVEINPQYIPAASRTTPAVQKFETNDISALTVQTRSVSTIGKLVASGAAFDGTTSAAIVATAPGNVRKTHGTQDAVPNLALADQAQADRTAQLLIANRNNPHPNVSIQLAANNRLIDVAPAMYVTLDVPADLNPRGVALTDFPVLPKRVSYTHDPATGVLSVSIDGEGYTDETTRLDGAEPQLAFSF